MRKIIALGILVFLIIIMGALLQIVLCVYKRIIKKEAIKFSDVSLVSEFTKGKHNTATSIKKNVLVFSLVLVIGLAIYIAESNYKYVLTGKDVPVANLSSGDYCYYADVKINNVSHKYPAQIYIIQDEDEDGKRVFYILSGFVRDGKFVELDYELDIELLQKNEFQRVSSNMDVRITNNTAQYRGFVPDAPVSLGEKIEFWAAIAITIIELISSFIYLKKDTSEMKKEHC